VKPLGPALLCGALIAGAAAFANPIALAACALAAALVLAAAPAPRGHYLAFALPTALLVFLVNPFAGAQGLTPLWQGPHLPLLDSEVTVEELAFGAAAGLRIVAASLAFGAFVRLADGDLVLRALARAAPRSALLVALAARLLPQLERDAAGIVLAARTRSARLDRPRAAALLLPALIGSSLERSLAMAEAMEARGYGGGRRSRAPERPATTRERLLLLLALAFALLTALALARGWCDFRYYDTLGDPLDPPALAVAALTAATGACAFGALRWRR
jgi:energy-coupling factor transport system permease protein